MKKVGREEYAQYLHDHALRDHVTEGHTMTVIQWLDDEWRVAAQTIYSRPVDAPGVPVTVTYEVADD